MIVELWVGYILWIILLLASGARHSPTTVGFGGSTSTTTTVEKVEPSTPEDIALKKVDLEFSQLNLERFKQEQSIIDEILAAGGQANLVESAAIEGRLLPLREEAARLELENAPLVAQLQKLQLKSAQQRIPIEQKLLEEQLAFVERGGLPSEEQFAQIDELLDASRTIAESQLDEAALVAGAQRGLRITDTPIGGERLRQQGLLEAKLLEQRSSLALGQPLNVAQFTSSLTAPSLQRTPQIPFSTGQFAPALQPTAPSIGALTGARAGAATNFAPTFGPQFFVTGNTTSSGRRTPNIGGSIIGALGSIGGGFAAAS